MTNTSYLLLGFLACTSGLFGCRGNSSSTGSTTADATDAQKPSVDEVAPQTCQQCIVAAHRDFTGGSYTLHSGELRHLTTSSFIYIISRDYDLGWQFVDTDAPGTYWGCYDSVMVRLLQRKYGPAFLARASHEADSVDATGTWYSEGSFPGGAETWQQFLHSRINWQLTPALPDSGVANAVFVSFVIDKSGRPGGFRILKGLGGRYDQEALRVVGLMPPWRPAYNRGVPVPAGWTVSVRFSQHMKTTYSR